MAILKKLVNKKLGEVLIDSGYLTPEDISSILDIQKQSDRLFGEIVVEEGFCSEENIICGLVGQLNSPYLDISGHTITEDLVKKLPYSLISKCKILPLDEIGDIILVAITSPVNSEVYHQIEHCLGNKKIHLCIADMNQVKNKIESLYTDEEKIEIIDFQEEEKIESASAQEHFDALSPSPEPTEKIEPIAEPIPSPESESEEEDDGMTGLGSLLLGD